MSKLISVCVPVLSSNGLFLTRAGQTLKVAFGAIFFSPLLFTAQDSGDVADF